MTDEKLKKEQEKARCKIWSAANTAWNELSKQTENAALICADDLLKDTMSCVEHLAHVMESLENSFVQPVDKKAKLVK